MSGRVEGAASAGGGVGLDAEARRRDGGVGHGGIGL
jgi:hypothetical protein